MVVYAVLRSDNTLYRVERVPERAERYQREGYEVLCLTVQQDGDSLTAESEKGVLVIAPGRKEWRPKTADKPTKKKEE